ncbi:hypothetical protein Pelo_7968 [Pelomyxa schiedti]|nr:hypothetical protein Pelo_7968 [Pelomyxa schiedti]
MNHSSSDEGHGHSPKTSHRAAKKMLRAKAVAASKGPLGEIPPAGHGMLYTTLKVIGLVSLIPMVLGTMYAMSFFAAQIADRMYLLAYAWAVYTAVLCFIYFYWRKATITLESFSTQNVGHFVISVGAYHFLSIANILPVHHRRVGIYLWITITMLANIVIFFIDDTDYAAKEREQAEEDRKKEEEREKQKQERKLSGKVKKKPTPWWRKNRTVRILMDIVVYVGAVAIIVGVVWACYRSVEGWKKRRAETMGKRYGYDSDTGQEWDAERIVEEEWKNAKPEDFTEEVVHKDENWDAEKVLQKMLEEDGEL